MKMNKTINEFMRTEKDHRLDVCQGKEVHGRPVKSGAIGSDMERCNFNQARQEKTESTETL